VTTTFPVVAPGGTDVVRLVAVQLVTVVAIPLNVTLLVPCVEPKFVPVIVTTPPTGPEVGFILEMLGGGATVKFTPLLAILSTVTTTFPVVAAAGTVVVRLVAVQLITVAAIPLNVTVLARCVAPKPVPLMVTTVPTGPELGVRLTTPTMSR